MTRLSQPLALTSLLLLAACSAPSMDASLQYSPQSLSGGVLTDTTAGAAENTWSGVGLDGSADALGVAFGLEWGAPRLDISTRQAGYSGRGELNSEIEIDGDTIGVGTTVDSDLDVSVTKALWTWDIAPGDLEVRLGLGLVGLGVDMRFEDTASSSVVSSDEIVPVPVLAGGIGKSFGPWAVAGSLSGFDVKYADESLSFYDLDAYGKYSFIGGDKRLSGALVLGYRWTDFSLDLEDGGDRINADLGMTGPYLGLRLSF